VLYQTDFTRLAAPRPAAAAQVTSAVDELLRLTPAALLHADRAAADADAAREVGASPRHAHLPSGAPVPPTPRGAGRTWT
jgi:hypothetical protein